MADPHRCCRCGLLYACSDKVKCIRPFFPDSCLLWALCTNDTAASQLSLPGSGRNLPCIVGKFGQDYAASRGSVIRLHKQPTPPVVCTCSASRQFRLKLMAQRRPPGGAASRFRKGAFFPGSKNWATFLLRRQDAMLCRQIEYKGMRRRSHCINQSINHLQRGRTPLATAYQALRPAASNWKQRWMRGGMQ